jgi:hypothetical protein
VNLLNSQTVECAIDIKNFNGNFTGVDIGLSIQFFSKQFDLSVNNKTFYAFRQISWEKSIINPNITSNTLFFQPPLLNYNYSIQMRADSENEPRRNVNCTFFAANKTDTMCEFDMVVLKNLTTVPCILNFELNITDPGTGKSAIILIQSISYYHDLEFQHLKPYFISFKERFGSKIRAVGNVLTTLRSDQFKFFCNGKY